MKKIYFWGGDDFFPNLFKFILFIGFTIVITVLVCSVFTGCSRQSFTVLVDAEVISEIDKEGIVGVRFKVGDQTFFEDLELSQSLVGYYKDAETIPLKIIIFEECLGDCQRAEIRLNGYWIKERSLSDDTYEQIRKATVDKYDEGRGFNN